MVGLRFFSFILDIAVGSSQNPQRLPCHPRVLGLDSQPVRLGQRHPLAVLDLPPAHSEHFSWAAFDSDQKGEGVARWIAVSRAMHAAHEILVFRAMGDL